MHAHEIKILSAFLVVACLLTLLLIFFIITIRRYHKKHVALYKEKLAAEIWTLEKERKRVAGDLHDQLGPMLSAIKLQLSVLEPMSKADLAVLKRVNDEIDEVLKSMRIISNDLLPGVLERKGIFRAIEEFVFVINESKLMRVSCLMQGDDRRLHSSIQLHIFRAVYEIMNNATRHSDAKGMNVILRVDESELSAEVKDDGKGFDFYGQINSCRGNGLQNILSRVELLKGSIDVTSNENEGTTYLITIPFENDGKDKSSYSRRPGDIPGWTKVSDRAE